MTNNNNINMSELNFDGWESKDVETLVQCEMETETQENDGDWRIAASHYDSSNFESHTENILRKHDIKHDCMLAGWCNDPVHHTYAVVSSRPLAPGQRLSRHEVSPAKPSTSPSMECAEASQSNRSADLPAQTNNFLWANAVVVNDHSYTKQVEKQIDLVGVQSSPHSCESMEIDVVSVRKLQQSLASMLSVHDQQEEKRTGNVNTREPARKQLLPPANIPSASVPRRRRFNTNTDSGGNSACPVRRERLRRIALNKLFEDLKNLIPAFRNQKRTPKIKILREATAMCIKLHHDDLEYDYLKKKNKYLLAMKNKLSSAAHNHPESRSSI